MMKSSKPRIPLKTVVNGMTRVVYYYRAVIVISLNLSQRDHIERHTLLFDPGPKVITLSKSHGNSLNKNLIVFYRLV